MYYVYHPHPSPQRNPVRNSCRRIARPGPHMGARTKPTCATRLELAGDNDKEELECLSLEFGEIKIVKGGNPSSSPSRCDPPYVVFCVFVGVF